MTQTTDDDDRAEAFPVEGTDLDGLRRRADRLLDNWLDGKVEHLMPPEGHSNLELRNWELRSGTAVDFPRHLMPPPQADDSRIPSTSGWVYVLELEDGCWYVGHAVNPPRRFAEHFNGLGSLWTRRHRPARVVEVRRGGRREERMKTVEMMARYGREKVRGAGWCGLVLGMDSEDTG